MEIFLVRYTRKETNEVHERRCQEMHRSILSQTFTYSHFTMKGGGAECTTETHVYKKCMEEHALFVMSPHKLMWGSEDGQACQY